MRRVRDQVLDGLLALVLLVIGLIGTAPAAHVQNLPPPGGFAYGCVVVGALAVAVRRLAPTVVLAVCTAGTGAYLMTGNPYGPVLFSLAVALYTVAAHRPLRFSAPAAGTAFVVLLGCDFIGAGAGLDVVGPIGAWIAAPLAIGVVVRVSREQVLTSRRDEARRQADAERLRVAQEVHDVVGHGLSAINMQAEIALHLMARQPGRAEEALIAISRTSRESLEELRATLGAVRRGDDLDDRTPVPGLARLDALVDRTRAVGVPVTLDVNGPLDGLSVTVDLTAYRIVQESLTNVLRHAGPATAAVDISVVDDTLTVEVTDTGGGNARVDGDGAARSRAGGNGAGGIRAGGIREGGGHGLAGMRERVTALGGSLAAGPRPEGGFAVSATLPVHRS
jgi:signal transduction histidine kinase